MSGAVDSSGNLSFSGEGCTVAGTLTARPFANVYDAAMTLTGACPVPSGLYAGHAFQSFSTGQIDLMVTDASGGQGLFMQAFTPQ